jgi:hypothetical protein
VTVRPCNRFPCPNSLATWTVGAWGPCVAVTSPPRPCDAGVGTQARSVVCRSPAGVQLADSACNTTSKPVAIVDCTLPSACSCQTNDDCAGSQWICDRAAHSCACGPLWAGDLCEVPLLPPSHPCDDGVVDVNGVCCTGFIDSVSGGCCPEGSRVDAVGRCCITGSVDACGVCGGSSVAVDRMGVCCPSALLPSGLCCVDGMVDSCGVCGGLNLCLCVA